MGARPVVYLSLVLFSGLMILIMTTDLSSYIKEHWVPRRLREKMGQKMSFWKHQDNRATFSVLSYNIWFSERHVEERMKALSDLISDLKPDFITLQEVTAFNLKYLKRSAWFLDYKAFYSLDNLAGYFVAIFVHSKHSVEQWKALPTFESSRMQRSLLWVETKLNASDFVLAEHFTLGTAHLESLSLLQASLAREKQLNQVLTKELIRFPNACFTGDTNIDSIDGEVTLPGEWRDAWLELGRTDEQGYTWNTAVNPYAQENPEKARYDRILCKLRNFELKNMKVVGDTSKQIDGKTIFPSDHFGIFTTFTSTLVQLPNKAPGPEKVTFNRKVNL